jgi:hypothetical protein
MPGVRKPLILRSTADVLSQVERYIPDDVKGGANVTAGDACDHGHFPALFAAGLLQVRQFTILHRLSSR